MEAEVLIEDWTSSDDESKTKESHGDSKIKMSSTTVKSEMLPKPESSQIRISFPAARQVSHRLRAQKKKPSPLSIISQVCKRLENKQVKISSPIQQTATQHKKPQAYKQVASSSKQAPTPAVPHEPVKHQKPFKACFKCGKGDHVLKKCPKGHASDGKGKQVCFSGSVSRKNPPQGKGKQVCFFEFQVNNQTSLNGRMTNIASLPSHVKPVSHDSKMNMTTSPKQNSFSSGLKQKMISKFNSFKSKMFEPKQIWQIKKKEEKISDTKTSCAFKHVYYADENGTPRTTMAWVPLSN